MCTADATPSGVSRVRVIQTSLQECDLGLHKTVTVDSHRQRTDTSYKGPALASLEWTCFPLPLTTPSNIRDEIPVLCINTCSELKALDEETCQDLEVPEDEVCRRLYWTIRYQAQLDADVEDGDGSEAEDDSYDSEEEDLSDSYGEGPGNGLRC